MSADKQRSLGRRRKLLARAVENPIPVNCQGGIGSLNPDLRRLVDEGLVRIARYRHEEGDRWPAPKRFRPPHRGAGVAYAPQTRAVITDAGRAALGL